MFQKMQSFKWTWILNIYSVLFLAVGASMWLDALIEDVHRAHQASDCIWIGSMAVLLGLWLYSRRCGGWRAIEPPPEVFLFWFFLWILTFIVFLFLAHDEVSALHTDPHLQV